MQVDWVTVAAQAVNFLVLVWLLQRFLYAPVMRAMERRERRIADRLEAAERREAEAEAEAERHREAQVEFEARREAVMAEAEEVAERERLKREEAARAEVAARKRQWLAQLEAERESFLRELRRHAAAQFWRLARRALGDLADAELEARVATSFAAQLGALDAETRATVAEATAEAGGRVRLLSRFALADEAKERLARAIREHVAEDAQIAWEVDEAVLCGIELRAGSQAVRWSLDSYLDALEQAVGAEVARAGPATDERAAE